MQRAGIDRIIARIAPHAIGLCISLHQCDAGFIPARHVQIAQGFRVNREETAGRTIFRRHVGNRRTVGQRQMVKALAIKLHELVHHAVLAQHLHHFQHQIGGCRAFNHRTCQLETHHFRDQHRNGLAQHCCLCLNPAHAPAQHGQTVDHGGVAVCAHQRIGIGHHITVLIGIRPDRLRQIFKVHLMANPRSGRHNAEIVERLLPPFQENIAFHVPLIFAVHVHLKRPRRAEFVNHHRMVDHQINRRQRVDLLRIAAKAQDPVAHRRKVHHRRHTREILHQHARRAIRNLARVLAALGTPFRKGPDIIQRHRFAVFKPQHVFQHNLQAGWQAAEITQTRRLCGRDRIVMQRLAPGIQCSTGLGAVVSYGDGHAGLLAGGVRVWRHCIPRYANFQPQM